MQNRFRSLRVRLLLPLLAVALVASVAVALGSYAMGDRWARDQLDRRFRGMESSLSQAPFPLYRQVLTLIAEMTDTELITLAADGSVEEFSLDLPAAEVVLARPQSDSEVGGEELVTLGGQLYRARYFDRADIANDGVAQVVVLFDEAELRAMRWREASLPLITGLSTIVLLTSVTLLVATRLIRRLTRLQVQVDRISEGEFDANIPVGTSDEVGMLGQAVVRMSQQLKQMWLTIQRQQGQKLLHQVASGMAHQLRNSITGARMAVELHGQACSQKDESLAVALDQLEQTEQHIRRLVHVASGKQEEDVAQSVGRCLDDLQPTLTSTAKHLHVDLSWQIEPSIRDHVVLDGPSLSSAVTNLVLNAMQAAKRVEVRIDGTGDGRMQVDVIDDGTGPPEDVADEIFEPFVTSKPEGLGLGLPLVAQSAERLGGEVKWKREGEQTRFTMTVKIEEATT